MEQQHHNNEEGALNPRFITGDAVEAQPRPLPQPHGESDDERAIRQGIETATAEERELDAATARAIAAQLHSGQDSALYSLASTGVIDEERVFAELVDEYRDPETTGLVREWINWLGMYAMRRPGKGPVEGWSTLWPRQPDGTVPGEREPTEPDEPDPPAVIEATASQHGSPTQDDEAEARAALMDRLNAAGVQRLGEVSTIYTADGHVYGLGAHDGAGADGGSGSDALAIRDPALSGVAGALYSLDHPLQPAPPAETHDDDRDDFRFHWYDAADWHADGGPDLLADVVRDDGDDTATAAVLDRHEAGVADGGLLDALFDREPLEELGSAEEMGWCGLVHHISGAGGYILFRNPYQQRSMWETDSDENLEERWQQLQREQAAFEIAARPADGQPSVWVASLADYNDGQLHGAWLDATVESDQLTDAVQVILRGSSEPIAEEYGIFDYDNFGSGLADLLGEYPSLELVSKVAQGIAEHGEAFAAWAAYIGPESEEELDRFADHYRGEWDSMEAYAEDELEEMEAYRYIEQAPEWLQPYLTIDAKGYARDLAIELNVVETPEGRVWVFDTRA